MRTTIRRRPKLLTVRGYMRSGTNWVSNLLNEHPDISCVGEFHWNRMLDVFESLPLIGHDGRHHHLAKRHLQDAIQLTVEEACRSAAMRRTRWVGDRTPTTVDLETYPAASHIVVVRDLRDVVVSRAFHLYTRPHLAAHIFTDPDAHRRLAAYQQNTRFFHTHPEELLKTENIVRYTAQAWAQHVTADEETIHKHPNASILRLRYEDLHRSTEGERRRMFEFLSLDPSRAPDLGGRTSPGFQHEKPTSILRRGAVGEWITYFSDETHEIVESEAGEAMRRLGYAGSDAPMGPA